MKKLLLYLSIAFMFLSSPINVLAEDNVAVENQNSNINLAENTNTSGE